MHTRLASKLSGLERAERPQNWGLLTRISGIPRSAAVRARMFGCGVPVSARQTLLHNKARLRCRRDRRGALPHAPPGTDPPQRAGPSTTLDDKRGRANVVAFLGKLWRGEYGLARTFWLWWLVYPLVFVTGLTVLLSMLPRPAVPSLLEWREDTLVVSGHNNVVVIDGHDPSSASPRHRTGPRTSCACRKGGQPQNRHRLARRHVGVLDDVVYRPVAGGVHIRRTQAVGHARAFGIHRQPGGLDHRHLPRRVGLGPHADIKDNPDSGLKCPATKRGRWCRMLQRR